MLPLAAGARFRHGAPHPLQHRYPHVSLTVPGTVPETDWCTVAEAARRLGVTPTAIRNRIKRRTLEAKRNGNMGWLVLVPKPLPSPVTLTVPEPTPTPLPEPVTHRDERLIEAQEAHIQDLRQSLAEARQDAQRERDRADRLAARVDLFQHQRAADQAEIARLRSEIGRRPWWQRFLKQ